MPRSSLCRCQDCVSFEHRHAFTSGLPCMCSTTEQENFIFLDLWERMASNIRLFFFLKDVVHLSPKHEVLAVWIS